MRGPEVFLCLIQMLTQLLQIMPTGGKDLYEKHRLHIEAAIVSAIVYGMTLCLHIFLESQNSGLSIVFHHCALLSGALTMILILLMIMPIFAWILFGIWFCSMVIMTGCLRKELKEMLDEVVNIVRETLRHSSIVLHLVIDTLKEWFSRVEEELKRLLDRVVNIIRERLSSSIVLHLVIDTLKEWFSRFEEELKRLLDQVVNIVRERLSRSIVLHQVIDTLKEWFGRFNEEVKKVLNQVVNTVREKFSCSNGSQV